MKTIYIYTLSLIFSLASGMAFADYSVVVHPSNSASMSGGDMGKLFLAKTKKFPGGSQATPINLGEGSTGRQGFDSTILNKSPSQMKSYWSALVFSGKGVPPQEIANDSEVIDLISQNPSAIGYVDSSSVTADVKVVFTF